MSDVLPGGEIRATAAKEVAQWMGAEETTATRINTTTVSAGTPASARLYLL